MAIATSKKTKLMMRLEDKFGRPIDELLLDVMQKHDSFNLASNELGISEWSLRYLCYRRAIERQTTSKWIQRNSVEAN